MKYMIHFTLPDGTEDSVLIERETLREIANAANEEVAQRGATNPWSEEIK